MALSVIALNCTLKRGEAPSSTEKLLREALAEFGKLGVEGDLVHVANLDIKPGVTSDEGDGDEWPALRRRILAADILLIGTPIWLGQPSSVAKRVLERMDAFLSEGDERGRMPSFGKVAAVAVVGNEDGAHHCHAELFQGSTMSASASRPAPEPIGSARRWGRSITRIRRHRRRKPAARPPRSPPTPCISRRC